MNKRNIDDALIAALAAGASYEKAGEQVGVSKHTVMRRMKEADFKQRLTEARAALVTQTVTQLTAAGAAAVYTLVRLLSAQSESVQLGAAVKIVDLAAKLREAYDVQSRLAALEAQLTQPEKPKEVGQWLH